MGVKYHSWGMSLITDGLPCLLFPLIRDEFLWGQNDLLFMLDGA